MPDHLPDDETNELEYTLQVRSHDPSEEVRILRVHYKTRKEAEDARDEMFVAGLVNVDIDMLARRVFKWAVVAV